MTLRRNRTPTIGALFLGLILIGLFTLFQIQNLENKSTRVLPEDSQGWYSVYFTDPSLASASTFRGGPDEALVDALDAAQYSIDMAVYQLNLWSVRDALLRAHRRGIEVRVVTDSDNILDSEIEDLELAGITVRGDRRQALMHHKFTVIDGYVVWTGSMNYSVNGAYRNNNNLVRIRSSRIAQDYSREFDEMFEEDRFGALSLANTPYPSVRLDEIQIEILFSPDDGVAQWLIDILERSETSIDFLAFSFTSDAIANVMLERSESGIIVRGVFESSQAAGQGSEYERLLEAGLEVRLDGNSRNMHHKLMVVDREVVIFGSYNFSQSAEERNDENILAVYAPDLAEVFLEEFERVYERASK